MKILNVRFKNLNSLVGEWEIDFTGPTYSADGIFAITGPTGAGKTTILDAICLAIYGRTPRLDRVNKSANEIMSRQTGECFAEVTFETQAGRYRCHWAQHRARKKADGELQPPRQEIANADTGEIFEVKKRGVAEQIETVTGMDFDRFTRSMMLAQGGFAAFLQAAPDERAPILEQITGTEIYSEISVRVHERQREEQEKLNFLKAETAGIQLLDAEEEQECRAHLAAQDQRASVLNAEATKVSEAIAWLNGIDSLKNDIAGMETETKRLQVEIDAFASERDRLAGAQRAATLDGDHATLVSLRKHQTQDHAALEEQERAFPVLEQSAEQSTQAHAQAEQQVIAARAARKDAEPLIHRVRLLDQSIADQSNQVADAEQQCEREAQEISGLSGNVQEQTQQLAAIKDKRSRVETYLEENAQDAWLVEGFSGLEAQLAALAAKRNDVARSEADKRRAATTLEQARSTFDANSAQSAAEERDLSAAADLVSQAQADLERLLDGKLLREYRADKEALLREMSLLNQIAELEDQRAHLQDGQPCPLCGAVEHPYAAGNIPAPDVTEQKIASLTSVITQAEEKSENIQRLQNAEQAARDKLQAAKNGMSMADSQRISASKSLDVAVATLQSHCDDAEALKNAIEEQLRPLGIETRVEDEPDRFVRQLMQRRDAWQAAISEKADISRQSGEIQAEMQSLAAKVDVKSNTLANNQERLLRSQEALEQHRRERTQLFDNRQPDEEMAVLEERIASAESAEQNARAQRTAVKENLAAAISQIESLRQRIGKRAPELESSEVQFRAALSSIEFSTEAQFIEARLTGEQRAALEAAAQALDTRDTEFRARMKDRQAQLSREERKQVTDKPLGELQRQRDTLQDQLRETMSAAANLRVALQNNDDAKALLGTKQAAIDAQTVECRRWGNLHALIGSSDGKKYRNFAQGLTFEMMVGHANRQLQKMTDRYLLVRDPAKPLELNVLDNYQAGETRSTKNLSGGESFIVSLSLALGLSQMASRNVRVDSLFLDEGFGTLDEEALDTALDTLSGLQQEGKLIGVISHVQALKERISSQIQVMPQTGGRSAIAGPGCRNAEVIREAV